MLKERRLTNSNKKVEAHKNVSLDKDNEEWYNLAYDNEYVNLINGFRDDIPKSPTILPEESLIKLQEHHIPPVISREFYFSDERREWLKRFNK